MITNLSELVRPYSEDEFLSMLRSRTFSLQRGSDPARFGWLLTWTGLEDVLASGLIPPEDFRMTLKGEVVLPMMYLRERRLSLSHIEALLASGASFILNHTESHFPELSHLCASLTSQLGEHVALATIVTTGSGGALKVHYDREDLVLLQIEGTKRWKIYDPPFPDLFADFDRASTPTGEPFFDETLQSGDFMFIPAGYFHLCENGPGRSIHVAFMFQPPTGFHAVRSLLHDLKKDPLFRVPLSRFSDAAEKAAHTAALRSALVDRVGAMSLDGSAVEAKPKRPAKDRYQ